MVSSPARAGLAAAQAVRVAVFVSNHCNTRRHVMADHHTPGGVRSDVSMQCVMRCLSALSLLLLLGCASGARQQPLPPSPEAARPGAAAHLSTRAGARLVQQGYWVAKRDEQLVHCRAESVTGTMLTHTVCLTELQLRQQAESAQQARDALHQPLTPRCLGSVCAGADK